MSFCLFCSDLNIVRDLSVNRFTGTIPLELGLISTLQTLCALSLARGPNFQLEPTPNPNPNPNPIAQPNPNPNLNSNCNP